MSSTRPRTTTPRGRITRRALLQAGAAAVGLGSPALGAWAPETAYAPPPESEGGWRVAEPDELGVNGSKLAEAVRFHDTHRMTTGHGGAVVVVYRGHVIAESYTTGEDGGPRSWSASTCNDMKSSTKSVFGTAVGVFLDEFSDRVGLDSLLVGTSKEASLIPQIWDRPLTDPRKQRIRVKHALSMTSGHASREPWLAPARRSGYSGFTGPFQMYEYCFGWWRFDGIDDHHTLMFEPGTSWNYSNYGLEQLALAMRNISGERVGPYAYDRVLGPIGMPRGLRDNEIRDMPYETAKELNYGEEPAWGVGGSKGCDAYGADKSESPFGYNTIVGSTFRCSARDFARLGYLWLHRGRWGGRQLVPEAWMREATRRYVREDGSTPNNYGYTFWVQDQVAGVPEDLFMSRGHNLNHSYVIPSLDLVVVRQGNENRRTEGEPPFENALIEKIVGAVPSPGA